MSDPLPVYNPNEPAHPQETDADCAPESAEWMLWAYGRKPGDDWIEQSMLAAGVWNPDVGLTDASGAKLAAWFNTEYGEYGYVAQNAPSVDFDDVASEAEQRRHPTMIGGRAWYHWSGVRGYDAAADVLLLANPANGWQGVSQTMSRDQFVKLGPFSLVRLTHPAAEAQAPTTTLSGVDVSSHQGAVDWRAVAGSGQAFAFTKATGGTWYRNPTFAQNWLGIASAGLVRGAYHYAFESSGQPLPGDGPEAEADYFVAELKRAGGVATGDLLALDLEDGQGQLGDWCLRWLKRVEALTGVHPFVYTGAWFSVPHGLGSVPALAGYQLWLAAYQATPPGPTPPWSKVTIWQHTASGHVPGVSGDCDMNRFGGTRDQLLALGKPGTTAPSFVVGDGILTAMHAAGDVPATDELQFKRGEVDAWAEAIGASGARYCWVTSLGRAFRYPAG